MLILALSVSLFIFQLFGRPWGGIEIKVLGLLCLCTGIFNRCDLKICPGICYGLDAGLLLTRRALVTSCPMATRRRSSLLIGLW